MLPHSVIFHKLSSSENIPYVPATKNNVRFRTVSTANVRLAVPLEVSLTTNRKNIFEERQTQKVYEIAEVVLKTWVKDNGAPRPWKSAYFSMNIPQSQLQHKNKYPCQIIWWRISDSNLDTLIALMIICVSYTSTLTKRISNTCPFSCSGISCGKSLSHLLTSRVRLFLSFTSSTKYFAWPKQSHRVHSPN